MMQQPELGKKIAELRLAKGLTQDELARQCNLSVRTIQRIEAAEVTPRSYTTRQLFECLGYNINSHRKRLNDAMDLLTAIISRGYGAMLDLFNLKTNAMRKIIILSTPFLIFLLVMLVSSTNTKAQEQTEIKKEFENMISDESFMTIFNSGHIDSLAALYLDSACMMPDDGPYLYSRKDILDYYKYLYAQGFRFVGLKTRSYVISGDLAVERGTWSMDMGPGVTFSGVFMTQWHYVEGQWLIENEMNRADGIKDLNAMKE